jgi:hypothetical protein
VNPSHTSIFDLWREASASALAAEATYFDLQLRALSDCGERPPLSQWEEVRALRGMAQRLLPLAMQEVSEISRKAALLVSQLPVRSPAR